MSFRDASKERVHFQEIGTSLLGDLIITAAQFMLTTIPSIDSFQPPIFIDDSAKGPNRAD